MKKDRFRKDGQKYLEIIFFSQSKEKKRKENRLDDVFYFSGHLNDCDVKVY